MKGASLAGQGIKKGDAEDLEDDGLTHTTSHIIIFEKPVQEVQVVFMSDFPPFFTHKGDVRIFADLSLRFLLLLPML